MLINTADNFHKAKAAILRKAALKKLSYAILRSFYKTN
ncbi:hypothetical protein B4168_2837 [Anoxybacillus flavithermus]|nr:hypothetical protein B4168_2837 [Anoxybacillus flavithermus]OAO84894.1 hypothetical protein GT23_3280 [Parageobacillus thermoglucosidasius]